MKVVRYYAPGNVAVEDSPEPEPAPGEVKLRVRGCSACGTDLKIYAHGHHRISPPRVLGHEIAGEVVKPGSGVTGWAAGDRVQMIGAIPCGRCADCRRGWMTVCPNQQTMGYDHDGGFAESVIVPASVLAVNGLNRIPDGVGFAEASVAEPLACVLNGQQLARVGDGDEVVVVGGGPVGCLHVRLARFLGASRVFLVELNPERLARAARLVEPDETIWTEDGDVAEQVLKLTDGRGADVVITAAASAQAQEQAIRYAARRGRISLFGSLPPGSSMNALDTNIVHYRELAIFGASGASPAQNTRALELIASGAITVADLITHRLPIDQFHHGLELIRRGAALKVTIQPLLPDARSTMNMTAPPGGLAQLAGLGVSIWLDDISRSRLSTGNLASLMRDFHVSGVTSNPTIFAKALADGSAYAGQLADLRARGVTADEAVRALTTYDVRWACDILRPAYDASNGVDGRVNIEVDPRFARDTVKTVAEARALWWTVDRPNLFIKIPATAEGLPAITQCLSEGISVTVTLIFSLKRYGEVIDAFMAGLEQATGSGLAVESTAAFFVSRIDGEVDARLDKIGTPEAKALRSQAGIANARLAYELFEQKSATPRWAALEARGARPQRLLWASTSTKDPALPDTMYVTELAAPGTINTMAESTLRAMAGHGEVRGDAISGSYDESRRVFDRLDALGVSYDEVTSVLEQQGVQKFAASWTELLDGISRGLAG
jgi:L-iditol 2-dehydrogenase